MISSRRFLMRALEKGDLPFLHQLHNNYRNMSYFFEEPFETLRELEELFEKHLTNDFERRFIAEQRDGGAKVGVLSLVEIEDIDRNAEIDIIVSDEHRGQGYGKEIFCLGVKYAFDILNLYKLYLQVLPTNAVGRKIYEYFGFKEESRLIQQYFVDGEYVDAVRMCLFAPEWKERRGAFHEEFELENPFAGKVASQVLRSVA